MGTVLCIDDDESVARLVSEIVEFCDLEPVIITDSVRVAEHLRSSELVAVLCDFMMPKMDGIEVLTVVRDARPDVRRVLITAAPGEPEVKRAAADGLAQMVIAKPPSIQDIKLALAWL